MEDVYYAPTVSDRVTEIGTVREVGEKHVSRCHLALLVGHHAQSQGGRAQRPKKILGPPFYA